MSPTPATQSANRKLPQTVLKPSHLCRRSHPSSAWTIEQSYYVTHPGNEPAKHVDTTLAAADTDDDDDDPVGFQQNSIRETDLDDLDFEDCFETLAIRSVTVPSLMRISSFLHRIQSISRLLLTLFCYAASRKRTIGRAISHSRMRTTAPWGARPTIVTFCLRTALYTVPMFASSMPDTTRIIRSALVSSVSRSTIVAVPEDRRPCSSGRTSPPLSPASPCPTRLSQSNLAPMGTTCPALSKAQVTSSSLIASAGHRTSTSSCNRQRIGAA